MCVVRSCAFFFFNDTATTEIYTFPYTTLFRSQSDDAPVVRYAAIQEIAGGWKDDPETLPLLKQRAQSDDNRRVRSAAVQEITDRKSTRLNSSHANISYAVFCLKKKHRSSRADC